MPGAKSAQVLRRAAEPTIHTRTRYLLLHRSNKTGKRKGYGKAVWTRNPETFTDTDTEERNVTLETRQ